MAAIYLIAILAVSAQMVGGATIDNGIEENEMLHYRIDDTVIPSHYEIHLKPYLHERNDPDKRFTFDGSTEITISTHQENIKKIVLHARRLNFTTTELVKESDIDHKISLSASEAEHATHRLTISLDEPLEPKQNYILKFVFSGEIAEEPKGFYRQSEDESSEVWYAVTKFQPNYARRVFPCFDEPKFKATFTLHINRENEYSSAANTRIEKQVPVEGEQRTIDVYKPTPIMSSYLVAFLVSNFKARVSEHQNFTIWAKPDAYEQTKMALDVGLKILEKLEEFTGISYSSVPGVEKLDFVAVRRFPGAMENWGLVTYNEYYLFCNGSKEQMEWIEDAMHAIIAHELAHMWFGNLVTCEWWTHTWLNEGFATYIAYYITGQLLDYTKNEISYVRENMRHALYADKLNASFPLSGRKVEKSYEARQMFGITSYSKGGLIIRMIVNMMGIEPFKKAIHNYLSDNALKSVTPEHLFDALNKEWHNEDVDMIEFLSDWTFKSGYPLVTVKLSEDGEYITVSQKRYGKLSEHENDQWIIPFTFTTNVENDFTNTTPRIILKKNEVHVIPLGHKADWVIANIQQTGYYRVQYNIENWIKLTEAVKAPNASGIHHINHIQLRDDSLDFFSIGEVDIGFMSKIFGLNLGEIYGSPEIEPEEISSSDKAESFPTTAQLNKKIGEFSQKRINILKYMVKANKFDPVDEEGESTVKIDEEEDDPSNE